MLSLSPLDCNKEHLNKHTTISLISQWSMYPPPSWSNAMKIQFSLSSFVSRTVTETAWNRHRFKCRLKFMIHLKILKEVESATIVFIKHSKQRFCHQRILTIMWISVEHHPKVTLFSRNWSLVISPSGKSFLNSSYLFKTSSCDISHFSLRIFTISLWGKYKSKVQFYLRKTIFYSSSSCSFSFSLILISAFCSGVMLALIADLYFSFFFTFLIFFPFLPGSMTK